MSNAPRAIRDTIVADSSLGFTQGTNIFTGPIRPVSDYIPVECLFCRSRSGVSPLRVMGEVNEVRGIPIELALRWSKYDEGFTKAEAIMKALIGQTPSGYLDMFTTQSAPITAGPTEEGHHFFYMNYMLRFEESA